MQGSFHSGTTSIETFPNRADSQMIGWLGVDENHSNY
jgi:hypothetical protein